MRIRGLGRVRRAARWVRNRFVRRALILLYHRVAELPSDPQLLCVKPQHFAEHLKLLRKHYQPMPLLHLVQALQDGHVPDRSVVITFDDGYADSLYNARPLLERYDIPAIVFVTTGHVGQQREFWWDELERLFLQPGALPEALCLEVNGNHQWELGEMAHYGEEAYERHRHWNVGDKHDPTPRQHLYRSLCQLLRPLPDEERRKLLNELLAWAGAELMARPTHRALSPEEVIRLTEGELVEVGAHTVTHPILSALPAAIQRSEIRGSKARLEEILGRPVTSFAYPYGSRSDYTAETVALVRRAGFSCACANFADMVWQRADPFQLPRVVVRDWDGDEFARRLGGCFRG
jgi:peptidoglycan/xylan/chitin deacetylase (PgdA/CDA1 family)